MRTLSDRFSCDKLTVGTSAVRIPTLAAEQVINYGIQVLADSANTVPIYFGGTNVLAVDNGYPLVAGKDILIPVDNVDKVSFIAASAGQILWYFVV